MIRFASLVIPALITFTAPPPLDARARLLIDAGWRFHRGEAETAAATLDFDDSPWRRLDLPHDWSIESLPDVHEASAGGGGFFPTGIGWYRRALEFPQDWKGRRIMVEFEGVYRDATVWFNGHELGRHPYGYTPFAFDLTPLIRWGGANLLAVRVDNSLQPNSRWYSGSGIYRHVWVEALGPVHLVKESVFITTPQVTGEGAEVHFEGVVRNATENPVAATLEIECQGPDGAVLQATTTSLDLAADSSLPVRQSFTLENPRLWSPDAPNLHRAVFTLRTAARETDRWSTLFGIRSLSFSAEHGFELNGRPVLFVGGNVHHDHGPLGAASFDRAEYRKVERLKEAGFNAIRTSHNPPSTAFLNACDQLGMLVMDESFDGWAKAKLRHDYSEHFAQWALQDLEVMVRRDRNHPSVVMWSIGNEVFERGNAEGRRIARELSAGIHELDPTRPVTAGINGMGKGGQWTDLDPLFAILDVAGYNYEMARQAEDHARLPGRIIVGTESYLSDVFSYWKAAVENSHVLGEFVWTAMDYLGEAGIGRFTLPDVPATPHWEGVLFPWHGAICGDLDLTGWRKPISHYRNIVWDRGEELYAAVLVPTPDGRPWNVDAWGTPPAVPSWTWPGHEGSTLTVDVYSRCESVRVYLNDTLVGEQRTTEAEQFRARFEVTYRPGALRFVGRRADGTTLERAIETVGMPARIALAPDRRELRADGQDLLFVAVEIEDSAGRRHFGAAPAVSYAVEGPATIAGIGSADLTARETYRANPRRAFQGRALVVLRSTGLPGLVRLRATAPDLEAAESAVVAW